jgi:hypothetical protein
MRDSLETPTLSGSINNLQQVLLPNSGASPASQRRESFHTGLTVPLASKTFLSMTSNNLKLPGNKSDSLLHCYIILC